MYSFKRVIKLAAMILPAFLSGCMVGPNFHTPAPPAVTSYDSKPLPPKTVRTPNAGKAGKAQHFLRRKDIPAAWWALFHSEEINHLVATGIANSPNLAAAQATLRQAQETLRAQIGNSLFPAFTAALGGERQRQAGASFGNDLPSSIFNLFNATVNVSYTLDIFGGARRQIEALQAQVDYEQFQLLAAYLTLTSNIVTTAVTIASLEAQIEASRNLANEQQQQLNIFRKQFDLGAIPLTNVLTQQTLVDQTRATIPPLEKNLSRARHALAVLVGDFPNRKIPTIHLEKLNLPSHLPVSLPSDLVRQRPDVRASEALWHAASAQIGVATANLFPQFTITGNYGYMSDTASTLFREINKNWAIGAQLTQPIFRGGALFAQRRAAIAAYDVAAAQYKQTLLQAFQNVGDSLRAIEIDARAFLLNKRAETTALDNLIIIRRQYQLGGVSNLDLLNAQRQYQTTRINRIQAQAARYVDTAALFQALGGGWWNRPYPCGKDKINPTNVSMTCP